MESSAKTPPLTVRLQTIYGIGQVAEGVKNGAFGIFLFFYFNQVLGLSGSLSGLALLIALVVDAIVDPMVGSISDSFRHRWGRRHPFLYVSAVPMAVSFAFLFSPPAGLDQLGLFLWLTTFTILVRFWLAVFIVPHLALGAELSTDYRQRTTVVAYRTLFALLGVLLVVALAWPMFFSPTAEFPNGQLNPGAYPGFGVFYGVLIGVAILFSAAGTHGRIPHLPPVPDHFEKFSPGRVYREIIETLSNASFRALFIGVVIFFVMRGIQETLGLHMQTYFWQLEPERIRLLQLAGVVGFIPGIVFWTFLARRIDKKPTLVIGTILFSLCVLTPPIAHLLGHFPERGTSLYLGLLLLAGGAGAFAAAGALVAAGSMMADVADEHELATGRRQEGIFFGSVTLALKSASGIGHGVAGLAMDLIRFPAQAVPGSVDPEVLQSLGILYGPGIGLLAAIAIFALNGYSLDSRRHAEIVAALGRRADAGQESRASA